MILTTSKTEQRRIPTRSPTQHQATTIPANQGYGYNKNNQQDKPVNVSITLHGPVSKEQLYKIQEVLQHPSQYRDRIKPGDRPVKGEYANAFNKFCPKKVEVNEATIEEAIKYGHFLKRSEEDMEVNEATIEEPIKYGHFLKRSEEDMEVNEATIEEAIKYGHFLKRSEEDIAEAIDIYKTLGNETFYGPEEENPADQQEQPKQ